MLLRRLPEVLLVASFALAGGEVGGAHTVAQDPPPVPPAQDEKGEEKKGQADGEDAAPGPVVLDRQDTANLVATWASSEGQWTVQGLVLVSLGESWSPEAAPMLLEALTGKRKELAAFALERLRVANDMCLASTATAGIVEHLIEEVLADRDAYVSGLAQTLLERLFPTADCDKRAKWQAHWRATKETYEPGQWVAPPPKAEDGPKRTVAGAVGRALDLREAGLELCFCVDSTGSMQPMLDATAGAAAELTALLQGFAPELRVAAVFYKDQEDISGGAKAVHELTDKFDKVFRKIGDLSADGGGDIPEAVEAGLAVALDPREVGWSASTNKLVIVMGDAPPHPPNVPVAVELARVASTAGIDFAKLKKRPSTGKTERARPVVVSCIGVAPGPVPPETQDAFEQISAAGGGAYAALSLGGGETGMKRASQDIVRQVLRMAFGARWEDEVDEFLDVYFAYRERGWFD